MKPIKPGIEKTLNSFLRPETVRKIAGIYNDTVTSLTCRLNPVYWESIKRLQSFKDKHKGERCFILGNGPSLKNMDLTPLKNEITFGLNRIYLLFKHMGFNTSYFVSINRLVIEQCAKDIEPLQCPKFISFRARDLIKFSADTIFLKKMSGPRFCRDIRTEGIWEGSTVTYAAMQLAYYMGFSEVILIGLDHNYKTSGEPNEIVVSQGEDRNHFDPDYFSQGFKWQIPDLKTSEYAYQLAREAFENDGRRIIDATIDGKLQIFPKSVYEKIVSQT